MLSFLRRKLVITLLTSLLLWSTSSLSNSYNYTEWIFQVRSVSGFILSPGLITLKEDKAGETFLFPVCDFLQSAGVSTVEIDSGCLSTLLSDETIIVKPSGIFHKNRQIARVIKVNEVLYSDQSSIESLGFQLQTDSSEMIIMLDSQYMLPIDRRNMLSSQNIKKEDNIYQKENRRYILRWNRFLMEGQVTNGRNGYVVQNDFDLLEGEFITRKCDFLCQNYYRWTKTLELDNHQLNLNYGNFDYNYYPSKWDRLENTIAVEFNRKAKSRKPGLNLSSPKEYFIYRNGALIRKGQGSFENIELDLSEENYFSNYTIKIIDENGQIHSYDLYNGLGLLNGGDYSLRAGSNQSMYHFSSLQLGLTSNINVLASFLNKDDSQFFVKRMKTDFGFIKVDTGELTDQNNSKISNFLQGELAYKNASYIYGQIQDSKEEKNQRTHSLMLNLLQGIFQFHHRISNEKNFENELLLGRQMRNNFLYARYQQSAEDQKKYSLNLSGQYLSINYDFGPYFRSNTVGVFALISGNINKFSVSSSLDLSNEEKIVSNRIEYNIKNYSLYSILRRTDSAEDYGLGLSYSFFPSNPDLNLSKKAESIIRIKFFLDINNNNVSDEGDILLEGIGSYVRSKDRIKYTNSSGEVYFEQEEAPGYAYLNVDETSFSKMYIQPFSQSVRLKVNSRSVNFFEIPLSINGIIIISCSDSNQVRQLKVIQNDQIIFKTSRCKDSIFLDKQKAGEYKLTWKQGNENKELIINLSKENDFLKDVSLDE